MGVPVLSLPYSEKGKRLTKKLGLQNYSIPVERVEYDKLKEKIDKIISDKEKAKDAINKKAEKLKEKARVNVKLVYEMVK
jgi:polysaccharide pyruvyl transferase WcaK-like protein